MEVHAVDTLSGRETTLEIDTDATVHNVKRRCGEAFGFGDDVELSVGGQRVLCDGKEQLSNVAAFSGGCRVGVVRGVSRWVRELQSGRIPLDKIPEWAQQRRECVLALLAFIRRNNPLPMRVIPDWVHPSLNDDKEVMMQLVRLDPNGFPRASAELRCDKEFVTAALEKDASTWHHLDKQMQEDRDLALLAVPHCTAWLEDKAFVLEALASNSAGVLMLQRVGKALQNDKSLALRALETSSADFHLSDALRGDKEAVMKAFARHSVSDVFRTLSRAFRGDKAVVMTALEASGANFQLLSDELRGDEQVAMQALQREDEVFGVFQHASESLRGDKEVVMKALERSSMCTVSPHLVELSGDSVVFMKSLVIKGASAVLEKTSKALRADRDVVLQALQVDGSAFEHASEALRGDQHFVMTALDTNQRCHLFGHLAESLRADKEFVLKILDLAEASGVFEHLGQVLQEDRDVVMKLLATEEIEFEHVCDDLREDKEVVIKALEAGNEVFGNLSDALRGDKDIARAAVAASPTFYAHVPNAIRDDKDIALAAVTHECSVFPQLPAGLRDDHDVALAAITADARNYIYAGERVRGNKQAALAALRCEIGRVPLLVPFIPLELQSDSEILEILPQ